MALRPETLKAMIRAYQGFPLSDDELELIRTGQLPHLVPQGEVRSSLAVQWLAGYTGPYQHAVLAC